MSASLGVLEISELCSNFLCLFIFTRGSSCFGKETKGKPMNMRCGNAQTCVVFSSLLYSTQSTYATSKMGLMRLLPDLYTHFGNQ